MTIYFTGLGNVGKELNKWGFNYLDCDILDKNQISKSIKNIKDQDIIIHTSALTDVDYCEKHSREAIAVNVRGTSNILDLWHGKFIYLSSDHIFPGKWDTNGFREDKVPEPVNWYGRSKLAGETMAQTGNSKIIRTSKLFNKKLVDKRLGILPTELTHVIWRSFLHIEHFVDGLVWVTQNWDKCPEILNISSTDIMSYYDFYVKVAAHYGYDTNLIVKRRKKLKHATPRPHRAGLNVTEAKWLGVPIYSTYEGIAKL